jgi:hypothetical protein
MAPRRILLKKKKCEDIKLGFVSNMLLFSKCKISYLLFGTFQKVYEQTEKGRNLTID